MSGINYKSQINMPVSPTEDDHVVRKRDIDAIKAIFDDFVLETQLHFDFLAAAIESLGGSASPIKPEIHYDHILFMEWLRSPAGGSMNDTDQQNLDALNLTAFNNKGIVANPNTDYFNTGGANDVGWMNFGTMSEVGRTWIRNGGRDGGSLSNCYFTTKGIKFGAIAHNMPDNSTGNNENQCSMQVKTPSPPSVSTGVNGIHNSDNFSIIYAFTPDHDITQRQILWSSYGSTSGTTGENWYFEINAAGNLRFWNSSGGFIIPSSVYQQKADETLFCGMTSRRVSPTQIAVQIFLNGLLVHEDTWNVNQGANKSNRFYMLGNDYRFLNGLQAKGTLHSLRIYSRPLSEYEYLLALREDMEKYGK